MLFCFDDRLDARHDRDRDHNQGGNRYHRTRGGNDSGEDRRHRDHNDDKFALCDRDHHHQRERRRSDRRPITASRPTPSRFTPQAGSERTPKTLQATPAALAPPRRRWHSPRASTRSGAGCPDPLLAPARGAEGGAHQGCRAKCRVRAGYSASRPSSPPRTTQPRAGSSSPSQDEQSGRLLQCPLGAGRTKPPHRPVQAPDPGCHIPRPRCRSKAISLLCILPGRPYSTPPRVPATPRTAENGRPRSKERRPQFAFDAGAPTATHWRAVENCPIHRDGRPFCAAPLRSSPLPLPVRRGNAEWILSREALDDLASDHRGPATAR